MSYLDPLRLHFAGTFQAAPSTVNNDPAHFDNDTFLPRYQQYGAGATDGWWNPRGNADFRLIGCRVTAAWSGGAPVAGDPVLQCLIADSNTRVAAKLVDLDPEQQMVSEIWGLEVRIATADGTTLLKARFEPAAFADIWARFAGGQPDSFFGAMYQSVLVDLEWSDVSGSPFLTALKTASASGRLSIKFNVDGYDDTFGSPTFTQGRVAGTIGPAGAGEPAHLVLGRHFLPTPQNPLNACAPASTRGAGRLRRRRQRAADGLGRRRCRISARSRWRASFRTTRTTARCRRSLGTIPYRDEGGTPGRPVSSPCRSRPATWRPCGRTPSPCC